jgi:plasmid rolling circle replication initiator protein Rep
MRLGLDKKADRVCDCGSYLEFAHEVDANGIIDEHGKLHFARFCRDRFCPMCSWRRSLKLIANVSQCLPKITKDYKCLFLTLTIPNCTEEDFQATIDKLMNGWHHLTNNRKWKKVVKGFFRVLEVTRNKNRNSKSYKTLHPHFHIMLIVPKSYGTRGLYISRNEFLEMWQHAYGDNSITQVDVRLLKPKDAKEIIDSKEIIPLKSLNSALLEVCKYTLKDSDYLDESLSEDEQDNLLSSLIDGLHHRRLAHFGGVFKEIYNSLGLEDVEDENCDLTHIEDKITKGVGLLITSFRWGMSRYNFYNNRMEYKKEVI